MRIQLNNVLRSRVAVVAAGSAVMILGGPLVGLSPASATSPGNVTVSTTSPQKADATPKCATRKEYKAADKGTPRKKVERSFGRSLGADDLGKHLYRACDGEHSVVVSYKSGRLTGKKWTYAS